jgi:hypothetical protein
MLALINLLADLPWRLLVIFTVASALFIGGCQFGENRINAKWVAEKNHIAKAVADREQQVSEITTAQATINQEISNDIQQKAATLASDQHLLDRISQRVRIKPPSDNGSLSSISNDTAGANADAPDPVSDSGTTCQKLADDAAQTTLMLVEFQKWYRGQTAEFNQGRE